MTKLTLEQAFISAFEFLDKTYSPKWPTKGRGTKDKLLKAFSQNEVPIQEYLGYSTNDGIRHIFNRAIPNNSKPASIHWSTWLLSNIQMFKCYTCNFVYSMDCKSEKHKNVCKDCRVLNTSKDIKYKAVLDHLKKNPCKDCGETDPVVLEFDHLDPSTKSFNIGEGYGKPLAVLLDEIQKCDVVCANCHRKRTSKVFGYYKSNQ